MDDLDHAQGLSERERDAGIAGVRAKVAGDGSDVCSCGEPIDPARRAAMPSARLCIDCQHRLEREGRLA